MTAKYIAGKLTLYIHDIHHSKYQNLGLKLCHSSDAASENYLECPQLVYHDKDLLTV